MIISNIQRKYGYMVLIMLLEYYQKEEEFEVCQLIEDHIQSLEELYGIKIQRETGEDFIEDYKSTFWRIGYSGETAAANLNQYFEDAKLDIEIYKQKRL